MAMVWVRIVILTIQITLSVCPFNRMAHTANSLHSDMHFGPRQSHHDRDRFRRGSWLRCVNEPPLFFPVGAAILDWN
jgi:hypothetical protein